MKHGKIKLKSVNATLDQLAGFETDGTVKTVSASLDAEGKIGADTLPNEILIGTEEVIPTRLAHYAYTMSNGMYQGGVVSWSSGIFSWDGVGAATSAISNVSGPYAFATKIPLTFAVKKIKFRTNNRHANITSLRFYAGDMYPGNSNTGANNAIFNLSNYNIREFVVPEEHWYHDYWFVYIDSPGAPACQMGVNLIDDSKPIYEYLPTEKSETITSNNIEVSSSFVVVDDDIIGEIANVTLPSPRNGKVIRIKKVGSSYNVNINSADLIDGSGTVALISENESLTLSSNGSSWFITGRYSPA
jgi:hypothetical protein